MFCVSIFDAANAILTTSSSQGSRVPPALQAILRQILIPFTFIFSKILLKKYTWLHIFSACLVVIGVAFSLVPTFKRMHDGTTDTTLKHG
jgi:drug/metabolite transporter (DMT)-like permease